MSRWKKLHLHDIQPSRAHIESANDLVVDQLEDSFPNDLVCRVIKQLAMQERANLIYPYREALFPTNLIDCHLRNHGCRSVGSKLQRIFQPVGYLVYPVHLHGASLFIPGSFPTCWISRDSAEKLCSGGRKIRLIHGWMKYFAINDCGYSVRRKTL